MFDLGFRMNLSLLSSPSKWSCSRTKGLVPGRLTFDKAYDSFCVVPFARRTRGRKKGIEAAMTVALTSAVSQMSGKAVPYVKSVSRATPPMVEVL